MWEQVKFRIALYRDAMGKRFYPVAVAIVFVISALVALLSSHLGAALALFGVVAVLWIAYEEFKRYKNEDLDDDY